MAITYGVVPVRAANLTASGATAVFAVTTAPSAGSLLVMSVAIGNSSTPTATVTDTKGNTWHQDNAETSGAGGFGSAWTFSTLQTAGTLTTSDTVTITFSISLGGTLGVGCDVREFIGASNTVDSSGNSFNNGASGTFNSGTLTPVASGCAVVASFGYGGVTAATFNATGTVGTYLDTNVTNFTVGANPRELATGYLLSPTAGVAQQLDVTFGALVSFEGLITAYKAAVATSAPAGVATVASVSLGARGGGGASPGVATVLSVGKAPSVGVQGQPSTAQVSSVGLSAAMVQALAGAAVSSSVHALNASVQTTAQPGVAVVLSVSKAPSVAAQMQPSVAQVRAGALSLISLDAPAGVAGSNATALNASVSIGGTAGVARVMSVASAPLMAAGALAAVAVVGVAGLGPVHFTPRAAASNATAFNASVITTCTPGTAFVAARAVGAVFLVTPKSRTVLVQAESRVVAVPFESRTLAVGVDGGLFVE